MEKLKEKVHPYIFAGLWQRRTPEEEAQKILKISAFYYGITVDQLTSRTRKREVVAARVVAAFFMHQVLGKKLSYAKMAFILGMKLENGVGDHSVLHYYVRKYRNQSYIDLYRLGYEFLNSVFYGGEALTQSVQFTDEEKYTSGKCDLKAGKSYQLFDTLGDEFLVRNDKGKIRFYKKNHFKIKQNGRTKSV